MSEKSHVFTISPGRPFLDALATQLLAETSGDPLELGRYTVLLPTRRSCRAAGEAFLRSGGGRPLVLPTLRPIGEIDEDLMILDEVPGLEEPDIAPAVPSLRRQLLLTRLILSGPRKGRAITHDQAARLAAELSRLLDQVQTERLTFNGLATLVPEDYSAHWQETLDFLKILTEHWPAILAEDGALDPAERRNRVLAAQVAAWTDNPPEDPVVAAGSTGSIPATADLLAVVAALPNGRVVLPGLQREVGEGDWAAIGLEQTHPQNGMAHLLAHLRVAPEDVEEWPSAGRRRSPGRVSLATEMLRAAETTDAWRALPALSPSSLRGLERIDCANEGEEAGVIALKLRHVLETPGKTAALITPDRNLARRVAAELRRWQIEIDDSGGQALGDTAPGTYLRALAKAAAMAFSPVAFLSLLKHPLAAGGMAPGTFRSLVRTLERAVLRGPRPGPGFGGLRAVLEVRKDTEQFEPSQISALSSLFDFLESGVQPLAQAIASTSVPIAELIDRQLAAAEALAASEDMDGGTRLWAGDAGEALANFFAELRQSADVLPQIPGVAFAPLIESLMSAHVVRPTFGRHPRLNIWGPLEARLQHANLIILGGLNEGTWPPEPAADPWLSRPMRKAFGLPQPERRIGLSAHDFGQAFCAGEVVLTRANKVDGTPTVPSRWLVRLDTVLAGAGLVPASIQSPRWQEWHRALDQPRTPLRIAPPEPRPPLCARPRRLSVTRVETWIRDPYAIYARHILGLAPIDPLEADPGAAERGIFIHRALEAFLKETAGEMPDDAVERLLEHGEHAFGPALSKPSVRAFWWPRFERIADWFVQQERARRPATRQSLVEVYGQLEIAAPGGIFTLSAMADRIDRGADRRYAIIDYKTGSAPASTEVALGFAPQLPLEAAIAMAGGFEGVEDGAEVGGLSYWRLTGGEPAGEERSVGEDAMQMATAALAGLQRLVAAYDDETTAYLSVPNPRRTMRYNDYLHLARVQEWSASGAGDGP